MIPPFLFTIPQYIMLNKKNMNSIMQYRKSIS